MGLITGLLTLPLAPVRGTMWIAEVVLAEAEKQQYDETPILNALQEVEASRAEGELTEQQAQEAEDALLEQLIAIRGVSSGEIYGPLR